MLTLLEFLKDAKKAVGVLTLAEGVAVSEHFLNHGQASVITAVLGALSAVLAYFLKNTPSPKRGKHEANG